MGSHPHPSWRCRPLPVLRWSGRTASTEGATGQHAPTPLERRLEDGLREVSPRLLVTAAHP